MITELWLQTCITAAFWYDILCVLTFITWKLQVVSGDCTYRMTALLLDITIFCVRPGCEIQLASYGSKHALQSLFSKSFVHTCTHNFKTTVHIWTFCIPNNFSTIEDIPCVVWSCMRDMTKKLWPQTHIGHSLIKSWCVCTASSYIHRYCMWCATRHDNKTHVVYDCATDQTAALLPTMHHFMRTNLASYSIHIAISFQFQWTLLIRVG